MGISIGAIADVVGSLFAEGGAAAGAGEAAAAAIPEAVAITPEVAGLGAAAAGGLGAAGAGALDAAALGFPSAATQGAIALAPSEVASGLTAGTAGGIAGAGSALPAAIDFSSGAGLAALAPTAGGGIGALAPVTSAPLAPVGGAAPGGAAAGGGIGSAASTAAPAGVAGTGGDVTAGLQGVGSAATSSSLPGAVGQGAAAGGAPSLISGTQAVQGLAPSLGAAPATAPETLGGFISNPSLAGAGDIAHGAGDFLAANPALALGGAALGFDALKGSATPPGYKQIGQEAQQLAAQAKQQESYLTSGQLPPGIAQSLNEATNAAMATIRSQYASRGMSGSSAEAEDLQNASTARASQAANIAMQLYNQGVSESQISAGLYGTIMDTALQQDAEFSNALGNLTFAMAGGVRPLTAAGGQAAAA